MKANELMIGDWVTIKDEKRHGKVTQLCVTQYMEGGEWDEELCVDDFCEQFSNVEPIPLTEEILEWNGWIELSNFDRETYYSQDGLFTLNIHNGKFRMIVHSHVVILEYVHQLQHALRLCGLNDLADNFKIN